MSEEYIRQMRKLEQMEEEQRKLHSEKNQKNQDQYNTLDPMYDYTDYKRIVNTSLEYAPKEGQTWNDYYHEIIIHARIQAKVNRNIHIFGKNGHWHTHVDPRGCFMCEDVKLISMLVKIIGLMANQYPKNQF